MATTSRICDRKNSNPIDAGDDRTSSLLLVHFFQISCDLIPAAYEMTEAR